MTLDAPTIAKRLREIARNHLFTRVRDKDFLLELADMYQKPAPPQYRTLDCRNGIHAACETCSCQCHKDKHD